MYNLLLIYRRLNKFSHSNGYFNKFLNVDHNPHLNHIQALFNLKVEMIYFDRHLILEILLEKIYIRFDLFYYFFFFNMKAIYIICLIVLANAT